MKNHCARENTITIKACRRTSGRIAIMNHQGRKSGDIMPFAHCHLKRAVIGRIV